MQAGKMCLSFEWLKKPKNWSLEQNFMQFVLVETIKPVNLFGSAWTLGTLVLTFSQIYIFEENQQ